MACMWLDKPDLKGVALHILAANDVVQTSIADGDLDDEAYEKSRALMVRVED